MKRNAHKMNFWRSRMEVMVATGLKLREFVAFLNDCHSRKIAASFEAREFTAPSGPNQFGFVRGFVKLTDMVYTLGYSEVNMFELGIIQNRHPGRAGRPEAGCFSDRKWNARPFHPLVRGSVLPAAPAAAVLMKARRSIAVFVSMVVPRNTRRRLSSERKAAIFEF